MLEQRSTDTGQQNIVEQGTLFDKAELERLKVERRHWEDTSVRESQERMPERDNLMTTSSVPINRVYMPQDNENLDYTRDIGLPGEYPYTRGVQPTMYRAKPWTMRMFAGFGTAEDTNARFKYLLSQGQTGLSTAFDMPTLYGYDTDHPLAAGEFGWFMRDWSMHKIAGGYLVQERDLAVTPQWSVASKRAPTDRETRGEVEVECGGCGDAGEARQEQEAGADHEPREQDRQQLAAAGEPAQANQCPQSQLRSAAPEILLDDGVQNNWPSRPDFPSPT